MWKLGQLAHLCREKPKVNKRVVNATKLYEVDISTPILLEPRVDLFVWTRGRVKHQHNGRKQRTKKEIFACKGVVRREQDGSRSLDGHKFGPQLVNITVQEDSSIYLWSPSPKLW